MKLPKRVRDAMVDIRRRATRWANDNMARLKEANPSLPEGLNDRAQNNWEPLLAIADLCDDGELARHVALKVSGDEGADAKTFMKTFSTLVLGDIRDIFKTVKIETTPKTGKPFKAIASVRLAALLAEREDRPWAEYGRSGKPITPRGVARLLVGFQIRPKEIPSSRSMGYLEKQFTNAWRRYLSS